MNNLKDFDYVGRFNEDGLAPARNDGLWGFVDCNGKIVVPFKYEWTNDFANGIAPVKLNNKYAFINIKGELVTKFKYTDACNVLGKARIFYRGRNGELDPYTLEEHWY